MFMERHGLFMDRIAMYKDYSMLFGDHFGILCDFMKWSAPLGLIRNHFGMLRDRAVCVLVRLGPVINFYV